MNTVQKNNSITRKQVQELLEENQEKLGLTDKNLKKLIKLIRSFRISTQMRKVFYQECLKNIERNTESNKEKFKHLTLEDRISIEILNTAGFNNEFIGAFVGKHRASIKREIDKNIIETIYLGRKRWKIENEGFNIQKNGTFDIGHLYSKDSTAIKVHYLMIQIAHIIRQMLEKGIKEIKELKLKLKEISQIITKELISNTISNLTKHRKVQLRFD